MAERKATMKELERITGLNYYTVFKLIKKSGIKPDEVLNEGKDRSHVFYYESLPEKIKTLWDANVKAPANDEEKKDYELPKENAKLKWECDKDDKSNGYKTMEPPVFKDAEVLLPPPASKETEPPTDNAQVDDGGAGSDTGYVEQHEGEIVNTPGYITAELIQYYINLFGEEGTRNILVINYGLKPGVAEVAEE